MGTILLVEHLERWSVVVLDVGDDAKVEEEPDDQARHRDLEDDIDPVHSVTEKAMY